MTDDFAPDGQLAKAIPGFKPREPQRQMAVAVTRAIEKGQPLVVEAGTGTGKTYAYGSCAAGEKVIISTGSKALQDQLYSRDLPTVSKALKYTGNVALLKGRSNYLCLERLEQQALAGGDLPVQILSDVILLRSGLIKQSMVISAPASAWRKIHRRGRWSPAPTTTVLAATARCIKIALWSKHVKSDGRRCGGGKPSSLSGGYGG